MQIHSHFEPHSETLCSLTTTIFKEKISHVLKSSK
ncbi:hypothetical protein E2C01_071104 [Portunus trituberculatus]|uniref:Uncharacterized protein n=1 Tax=Portunus trituberculatus TaxID=210409 RepID=A0A5B7HW30_PORTR|nr:hypothetical protein [Portunus trituberculatus]